MKTITTLAGLSLVASLGACMSIPRDMSVGEYCSDARNSYENVCRLNVEIDGNRTALSQTNMSLNEARRVADGALRTANQALGVGTEALGVAGRAEVTANQALQTANSNSSRLSLEDMTCETRTLQKTNIGSCRPGYRVMSCTQTRFTYRAGGMSIMREIDDEKCRFQDRVLEMQVRCCAMASKAPNAYNQTIDYGQPDVRRPAPPRTPSPLNY